MKINKPSKPPFISNELLPSDESPKKSSTIDGEKIELDVNFNSKTKSKNSKRALCHIFGIVGLVASVVCSLSLWILLVRLRTTSTTTLRTSSSGDHLLVIAGYASYHEPAILSDIELVSMQREDEQCDPLDLPDYFKGGGLKRFTCADLQASVASKYGVISCFYYQNKTQCLIQTKNGKTIDLPHMDMRLTTYGTTKMVLVSGVLYAIGAGSTMETLEIDKIDKMQILGGDVDGDIRPDYIKHGIKWKVHKLPFNVKSYDGTCVAAINNSIIATVGYDQTWIYNINYDSWIQGPSRNVKRVHHGCFADQETNTVHIIGGEDNRNIFGATESFQMGDNKWKIRGQFPIRVTNAAAVSSRSSYYVGYVAGGYPYPPQVWGLRRKDMTWVDTLKKLNTPRHFHTLVNAFDDVIPGC